MFVFIGGLGTTYAYAAPWMRQLARFHGELFYFIALKDASIQHLEHILYSTVIPLCRQSGERVTLVGYSAGCSVLLHAMFPSLSSLSYTHVKILLIDPPALFPAWASGSSLQMPSPNIVHASYYPFRRIPKSQPKSKPKDPLLTTLLFGNPRQEVAARILQCLLLITANCSLARWIIATGWCVAEGWTTPWAVNADILGMSLPELRPCLMESILQYPAYPKWNPVIACGPPIKHVWASAKKKGDSSYATYALLLAEHSPSIRTHLKRNMDHHMLLRRARYLYV